ncbi:site-specific integrase [Lysobacter sp. CCNWLW3]|uniref:site-specific integrase n=1 Tax=unclassified Lysobacter TaxID=2635362 RepID=UPI002FD75083
MNAFDDNFGNDIKSAGRLRIAKLRMGGSHFQDIETDGPEGTAQLIALLREVREMTRRRYFDRKGQPYPSSVPQRFYPRKLSAEIQDYLRSRSLEGLDTKSVEQIRRSLTLLMAVCGDVYVSSISEGDILRLQEFILWTPKGLASLQRLKNQTPEQLIAEGKAANLPRPAEGTVDLHLRLLNPFFKNLVDRGILGHSPMVAWRKMRTEHVHDPEKAERVFSEADLQRIFDPQIYAEWASKWPHRFWGPILGLYTGARINEIAQLRLDDIVEKHGTWWMHIRATVDEDLRNQRGRRSRASVKCATSVRCIPIAQPVLDAGFLDFIADIRDGSHARLFPNLSSGPDKDRARYGVGLATQFGNYMKQLGFPTGVRFHAFRHTFVTILLNEQVKQVDIASVTGHALDQRVERVQAYGHVGSPKHPPKERVVDECVQMDVVAKFQPVVTLPRYERGQFKKQLGRKAWVYP